MNSSKYTNKRQIEIIQLYLAKELHIDPDHIKPLRRSSSGNVVYLLNGAEAVLSVKSLQNGLATFFRSDDPSDELCDKACMALNLSSVKISLSKVKEMVEKYHPTVELTSIKNGSLTIAANYQSKDTERTKISVSYPISTIKKKENQTEEDFEEMIYQQLDTAIKRDDLEKRIIDARMSNIKIRIRELLDKKVIDAILAAFGDAIESKLRNKTLGITTWAGEVKVTIDSQDYIPSDVTPYVLVSTKDNVTTYSVNEPELDKYVARIVKKLLQDQNKLAITYHRRLSEHYELAEKVLGHNLYDKYHDDDKLNECLFGKKRQVRPSLNASYLLDKDVILFESAYGSLVMDKDEKISKLKLSDKHKDLETRLNRSKYQKCIQFLKDEIDSFGLSGIYYESGSGLFAGPTVLKAYLNKQSEKVEYNGLGAEKSIVSWKKEVHQAIAEAVESIKESEKERIRLLERSWSEYASDFLSKDIVEFVSANDKYITPSAISSALRGTKINLNTKIVPTEAMGRYNLIDAAVIERRVYQLARAGILYTYTLSGTYCDFDVVHLNDNAGVFLGMDPQCKATLTEIKDKIQNHPEDITDLEAEKIFLKYKDKLDPAHQMIVMNLIQKKSFSCKYFSELVDYFASGDQSIFDYMKMMEDINDNLDKNRILKKIRIEAGKKQKASKAKTA